MFQNCENLSSIPLINFTTSNTVIGIYTDMFTGCSKIKISATQEGEYVSEYVLPTVGSTNSRRGSGFDYMFDVNVGAAPGKVLYTSNPIV